MESHGRLRSLVKLHSLAAILRINRSLRRAISWNRTVLKNKDYNPRLCHQISSALCNVNLVAPLHRVQKGHSSSNRGLILSFQLALSDVLYNIKARVRLADHFSADRPFYTLGRTASILLPTLSHESIQKVVYTNGIDLVFNFRRYFGLELRNVYDVTHLLKVYSSINTGIPTQSYSQIIGKYLGERMKIGEVMEEAMLTVSRDKTAHKGGSQADHRSLYFHQNYLQRLFPLNTLHRLRDHLHRNHNINNESFNLKMDSVYSEVKAQPRLYEVDSRDLLDFGTLSPKLFEDKFFSNLFEKDRAVRLCTEQGPFYGILLDRVESERKVILNINAFLVDRKTREVFPVHGIVDEESYKFFDDKKIGDRVECMEADSENIKVQMEGGKALLKVKRLYQESLIYSLRNRRYVPISDISVAK